MEDKSLIVVADTHFGLLGKICSKPEIFADFLEWLMKLENSKGFEVSGKTLKPPSEIILLGDIIELWDAKGRTIDASLKTLIPLISKLRLRKTYLLGNHDDIIEELVGEYPLEISIKEGVYQSSNYVFLHGHQFDRKFLNIGNLYQIIPILREAAFSMGSYIWAFVVVWVVILMSKILLYFGFESPLLKSISQLFGQGFMLLLAFFSIPPIFISVARPIWEKIKSKRYKREEEIIKPFLRWWKKSGKDLEKKRFLVYGHTHLADIISPKKIQEVCKRKERYPTLINLPAWVEDREHEDVFHSAFLYIDNNGFEFFGWDWKKKEPFFVPKESIIKRNRGEPLKKPEIQNLIKIGVPEKLAVKWEEPLRL